MDDRQIAMSATYSEENDVTLVTEDCLRFLATLPDGCARLVVTSPPYNIRKEYKDDLHLVEYIRLLRDVVDECVRIVQPGGSICFEVGNYMAGPNRPKPLPFLLEPIFRRHEKRSSVHLRNMIIWHFGHGLHAQRRFSGRYETIMWYTKGDTYIFNLDDVRVPQKYPGKRHYKGQRRGEPSGNPRGKNPSDVWSDIPDVWVDIPNVKANHVEKTEHPCQFPVGLPKRLILALSNPGELVVDPFIGVGSTAVAAVISGRRVAGCDLDSNYVAEARQRIRRAWNGELPVRDDRPIHVPNGNEAVARIPETWKTTHP